MRHLDNQTLLTELSTLVTKERELIAKVLQYLLEVETRKLFLERGYSSMFKFCMEYLKYSEAEAQIRIQAMRLLKALPQVSMKIESGDLSLSNAAQIQNQFRKETQRRKDLQQENLKTEEKIEIVNSLEKTSARDCERKLALIFPEIHSYQPEEKTKVLRDEKTLIQFTADKELMAKLETLKNRLAHKNFQGRYDLLFNDLADIALKKLDLESSKANKSQKKNNAYLPGTCQVEPITLPTIKSYRSRYISKSVRRRVWQKAKGQCEYQDPLTQKLCASKHALEFDHKLAFAKGGGHQENNLQLLCDQHNRLKG